MDFPGINEHYDKLCFLQPSIRINMTHEMIESLGVACVMLLGNCFAVCLRNLFCDLL